LAGGTATRLFPLTASTSKQLLPVYDRQMIFYPLNTLITAGVRDILMIVAPEHSGQFLNLLGSLLKKHGVHLHFEVQPSPRGLPEAFILGEQHIGDDNVALILGDNIFEDNFSEQIRNFKSGAHVFATRVVDPERFGVVKFNEMGKAEQIEEKPREWISDYAITGLYLYDHDVIEVAKSLKPSDRGEIEIVDLHRHYLNNDKLQVTIFDGAWLDAGTPDSLLDAGYTVRERGLTRKFDPILDQAIREFNEELKARTKKRLF
jgi:glucose-1-phosphate thymidylyltransferase